MAMPNDPIHILSIEDNDADQALLRHCLADAAMSVEITRAGSLAQATSAAQAGVFDLVLLDLNLPDSQGIDTVQAAVAAFPALPIIALTGLTGEKTGVDAVRAGAQDYLVKGGFTPDVLRRSIRYALERHAIRQAHNHLEAIAKDRTAELEQAARALREEIAQRQRAQEEMRLANARLQRFVDANIVGVVIANAAGAVLEANDYYLRLIGFTRAELTAGKINWRAITPLEWLPADDQAIQELHDRGSCTPYEKEYARPDGSRASVYLVDTTLPGPGEQIAAFVIDITQRKQIEHALRAKSEELSQTNDELTRFTYTVSHDLKSPLVTLKTFLGYLAEDVAKGDAPRVAKDIGYLRTAADKMSRLLDELLDLSRVGRKMNPSVDVHLQTVVQEALDLVAGRLAQRGVKIDVAQEPLVLHGDPARLVEVFQNLVDNAVKFMGDQPAPHIEIGADTIGAETVFFVRDNGIGIDPRHQSKLFGLFEKLDPRTEGTGLGLALVRRVVEVHGGEIWVESAGLGQGTTFRFTLAKTKRQSPKGQS
jgi:PAS domain S-box-containing protein